MTYFEIEFQTTGAVGSAIPTAYSNMNDVLAKHHHVMEYAQTSEVEKHGSLILDENLNILKAELGYRETPSQNLPVFFTLEVQVPETGNPSCGVFAWADKADAWNKWYTVMAYAAKSAVAKHGCMMITSDLFRVDARLAERNAVEPEEPEQEEQ